MTPPPLPAHPEVQGVDLQPRAHIQEVDDSFGLQHDVDGHRAAWRGVQQVLEDLQVRQEVHDDGNHLDGWGLKKKNEFTFSAAGRTCFLK